MGLRTDRLTIGIFTLHLYNDSIVMKNMSKDSKNDFATKVRKHFAFLEDVAALKYAGVRISGGSDPRDRALVARYERDDMRVDIGWNSAECSLAVLLKYEQDGLFGNNRYIYLEPFIEFFTNGQTKPIVPYVREQMAIKEIQAVADQRINLFKNGLDAVMSALAVRMESFLRELESIPLATIEGYHQWMKRKS